MNKVLATSLLVGSLALAGCSAPIEGIVVGKDYDPPHTRTYQENERYGCGTERYTTSSGTGKSYKTTTRSRVRYCNRLVNKTRRDPANWDITVRTDAGEERTVGVSQSAYNRVRVGERINTKDLR